MARRFTVRITGTGGMPGAMVEDIDARTPRAALEQAIRLGARRFGYEGLKGAEIIGETITITTWKGAHAPEEEQQR